MIEYENNQQMNQCKHYNKTHRGIKNKLFLSVSSFSLELQMIYLEYPDTINIKSTLKFKIKLLWQETC